MRALVLILAAGVPAAAGVVEGVALEWATGKPLSRTVVTLQPVPGSTASPPLQTRTGRAGQFQFGRVPDGLYVLEARRPGFLPAGHGQRRPEGYGKPVEVTKDSTLFSELRLRRMGALTGTVADENGVGIPGVGVLAYRAELPLRLAGRGTTDDRGVYRIAGLELGRHWVRSAAHRLDDGTGLLPVFAPEARQPSDAAVQEVRYDADTPDTNLRPEAGTLGSVSGDIRCDRPSDAPLRVTLSSEFAHLTANGGCDGVFQFAGLAPGMYELAAEFDDGTGSGFAELSVSGDMRTTLQVRGMEPVAVAVRDAVSGAMLRVPVRLYARRNDLSGAGGFREVTGDRVRLAQGHWEMAVDAGPGYYVVSIQAGGGSGRRPWRAVRPPNGFPVYQDRGILLVRLSSRPGRLGGVVKQAGLPVYLWPVGEETRRQLSGPRQTVSDVQGRFSFVGLPPGEYRVLATRDIREATKEAMDEGRAVTVTLGEGEAKELEVAEWEAP